MCKAEALDAASKPSKPSKSSKKRPVGPKRRSPRLGNGNGEDHGGGGGGGGGGVDGGVSGGGSSTSSPLPSSLGYPWSSDPILSAYKFTNVKREHDR